MSPQLKFFKTGIAANAGWGVWHTSWEDPK